MTGNTPKRRRITSGAVTIVDVAALAGVSTATVSHVLNGTRSVTRETRRRVMLAIEESGYTQNISARSLRRSMSESIGVITADAAQHTFAGIIRGVESEAQGNRLTLLLANSSDDPGQELRAVQALHARRIDGLIIAEVVPGDSAALEYVESQGIPVVAVDRFPSQAIDYVGVENERPMRSLVQHLLELGHKRIALVAGDTELITLAERRSGFTQAFQGAATDAAVVLEGMRTAEEARRSVVDLLAGADRPTALVGASLQLTLGTLEAIQQLGLRIPEDIALVTFDEVPYSKFFTPHITSVVQPAFEIGSEAMRLLLRRISEPENPPAQLRLGPGIEHGTSCGCPPGTPLRPAGTAADPGKARTDRHVHIANS
jgi:LacI family transcriptional regulator